MKKIWRTLGVFVVCGLLAITLGWATFATQSMAQEPVKIGLIGPLTGPMAYEGIAMTNGEILAAEEINKKGGILGGRQIVTTLMDDRATPEEGANAITRLIAEGCTAILGAYNSSVGLAENGVAFRYNVPIIHGAAAHNGLTTGDAKGKAFCISPTTTWSADSNTKGWLKIFRSKSVSVISETTDWGIFFETEARKVFDKEGVQVLSTDRFAHTTTDFSTVLAKIKKLSPDVLVANTASASFAALVVKQARQVGITAKFATSSGIISKDLANLAEGKAEGMVSGDVWWPGFDQSDSKAFVKNYEARFGRATRKCAMHGYEAMMFMTKAMEIARSDKDTSAINKAMHQVSFMSPRGCVVNMDPTWGRPITPLIMLTIKDGDVAAAQ